MEVFAIIGVLILILTAVLKTKLQLTVEDEDCPQDVEAVKTNKIGLICMLIIGGICTVIGIIGLIL